ncbi:PD-(D/E)XK nuclease superfamily protein [Sarcina sp. DSM 11001]|uniref:AAA family ATPase n=1 Tax=Sarcina sp. DSM 11001 TaxID=1798184 RepID=UPI00088D252E|nr:AAA family ATPase [Sarcina sp. DSM 11001]SDL58774.1 PD-(D/E)XK nuclease superfamily protein [Sarcina sp. DSM 11001]
MGIYLNPGNEVFRQIVNADLYIDKTMLLRETNRLLDSANKYICMSRPRRFGKTVTGNMLCSYYSRGCDSRELFEPFRISRDPGFLKNLNRYHVIKIDMNSEYQSAQEKKDVLKILTEEVREEMKTAFPDVVFRGSDSLARCILRVYAAKQETFIILLDEYDVFVREQVSDELFQEYLAFLNSLFKSDTLRPAISLAYLTGILPIVRDKVQSKLNNFREYTILNAGVFAEYVGFTARETEEVCAERGIDFNECRRWYNGYRQKGFEIYNPESVARCVETHIFDSYWGQTSSYEVISDRIRLDFAGTKEAVIQMLAGGSAEVDVNAYLNTMKNFSSRDDIFGYLLHLGYLAYDQETRTCHIPNKEVREEWFRALKKLPEYSVTDRIIGSSKALLTETWQGNADTVAKALDVSHIHVTSNRSYNNEDALQSAIYLAYIYALNRYTVVREMTAGKGYADVVFIPFMEGDPAMIVELKRNDSAGSAIDQIRRKQYFDSLEHYSGNLLFVGINYDEKKKIHTCVIEKMGKTGV